MANQKISQLTTIVTVDTAADLFPIVDTSALETKKITPAALKTALALNNVTNTSDADKPVSTSTQTALDAKVTGNAAITGATKTKITYDSKGLVTGGIDATTADIADSTNKRYVTDAQLTVIGNTSGTNTGDNAVNSLYSGLATSKQDALVSGTNIKTVNSTSLLGSGNVAVQPTLVSGTNIKTINSTSLLGSGDITISASPSGVSGAIQFSNGSAFASDASNFFWDNTNKRLGVGTNAPTTALDISASLTSIFTLRNGATNFITTRSSGIGGVDTGFRIWDNTNNFTLDLYGSGSYDHAQRHRFYVGGAANERFLIGSTTAATIKGSGSTSATTSLLVQNSAGSEAFRVYDDRTAVFSSSLSVPNSTISTVAITCTSGVFAPSGGNGVKWGSNVYAISSSNGVLKLSDNSDADFNRLQFGGTTSSYPSLKRSTTNLQVRLADDSGYAPIDASLYKVGGTNGFTGTGSYTNFTIVGGIITNAS